MWNTTARQLCRVPVSAGNITTAGMFDQQTELVLNDQMVSI
jgi:hypothetical protein